MQNIPVRKILSAILFILIIVFTYLIFIKLGVQKSDNDIIVLFGGLVFSSMFLFSIVFTRRVIVKTIYEERENLKQNENIKKEKEKISFKESLNIVKEYDKQKDLKELSEFILKKLAHKFNAVQGTLYVREKVGDTFVNTANYALYGNKKSFKEGEGINGQVATNKKLKIITDIPEGYISVVSGLGAASPNNLLVMPFVFNNKTIALLELASFEEFPNYIFDFYSHINNNISKHFNKLINEQ